MRLIAKHAQVGYLSPNDRPGCRNCKHLGDAQPENGLDLPARPYCDKHSIEVTAGAICRSHELPRFMTWAVQHFHVIKAAAVPVSGNSHQVNQDKQLQLPNLGNVDQVVPVLSRFSGKTLTRCAV